MRRSLRNAGLAVMVTLLLLAMVSCTVAFNWSSNPPYVKFVDGAGGVLGGVTVELWASGATAATASNTTDTTTGEASFSVQGGTYTLKASLAGYTFSPVTVTITENSIYLGTFTMYNLPYALVTDGAGVALADVVVALWTATGTSASFSATSDTAGKSGAGYAFADTKVTIVESTVYLGTIVASGVAVTGRLINAKAAGTAGVAEGVGTATITLSQGTTAVSTGTTGTDGSFSVTVPPGSYTLSGTKTGFFVIPVDVVAPVATNVGDVVAVPVETSTQVASTALSIIVLWNGTYQDVDGHLSFPNGDGTGLPVSALVETSFAGPTDNVYALGTDFGPLGTARRIIQPGVTTAAQNTVAQVLASGTDTRKAVELDRDARSGTGPETISIRTIPMWPKIGSAEVLAPDITTSGFVGSGAYTGNRLPDKGPGGVAAKYLWAGIMEYYVDGWNGTSSTGAYGTAAADFLSTTTTSADVTVYLTQGSTLLAKFTLPEGTVVRTASLFRINFFVGYETAAADMFVYYQIVPDLAVIDGDRTGIRSLTGGAPVYSAFAPGRAL